MNRMATPRTAEVLPNVDLGIRDSSGFGIEDVNTLKPTLLQDLPLEMLDMVLLKVVMVKLSEWLKIEPPSDFLWPLIVTPLRSTWSEWNRRLSSRWFRIIFKRLLKRRTVSFSLSQKLLPPVKYLGYGIAALNDSICILSCQPKVVCVYENSAPFGLLRQVPIDDLESPHSMACCRRSSNLYITDKGRKCIWKVSRDFLKLKSWLDGISSPFTLSFSADENHLLLLRDGGRSSALEMYRLDAVLVRSLSLPTSFRMPLHAVHLSDGSFIISHFKPEINEIGKWTISRLNSSGQLVCHFDSRVKLQDLQYPRQLELDRERNWLFVSDYGNDRVLLFDSRSLAWRQIVLTKIDDRIRLPRLCYDDVKKMLIVGSCGAEMNVSGGIVDVFRLNTD